MHHCLRGNGRPWARPKQWPSLKFFIGGEPIEHIQHMAGDVWGSLLVKMLNLFHTASQCAFISGLLWKLSVSIAKINCLSSFLCPLKVIGVPCNPTPRGHKIRQTFQLEFISALTQTHAPSKIQSAPLSIKISRGAW